MKFYELCICYEKLEGTTKKLLMVDILAETLQTAKEEEIAKIAYLTIGKLYPEFEGVEFMVAEKMAIKSLAMATGKNEKSIQDMMNKIGDLGQTAKHFLSKKTQSSLLAFTTSSVKYEPSVIDIWNLLNTIAKTTGDGSSDKKIRILSGELSRLSPLEAKYFLKIVLGNLRLGVAIQLLIEALSLAKTGSRERKEEIETAYNLCSDIGFVAEQLYTGGIDAVKDIRVNVFSPVKVMLAQRVSSAEEMMDKFSNHCALEYKYDGLRVQIHYKNGEVKLFSRRPENITHQFPDVIEYIKDSAQVDEFIIEGEIVAIDTVNDRILPFQQVSQRKRKHDIGEKSKEIPVKVFLFDILYYSGEQILFKDLLERRKILETIIKSTPFIAFSHFKEAKTIDDIEDFFNRALEESNEGLMGKKIGSGSHYQAGARGWNWVKYKADYKDNLSDSFDLLILGAYYGKGKRTGKYGSFLLGCYDEEEENFKTFTKVATGFSDTDLSTLYSQLKPLEIDEPPKNVISNITPDVWLDCETIIEVAGAEITVSQQHTCGMGRVDNSLNGIALRFPRFTRRFVTDRAYNQTTTVEEILNIYIKKKTKNEVNKDVSEEKR